MLRVTKLTDYAIVVLTHMALSEEGRSFNARDLAESTRIPQPTASKVLKHLAREGLVVSHRGVKGGYRLARAPRDIDVGQIVAAVEGPIAVTECTDHGAKCEQEASCPARASWHYINQAVMSALSYLSLADMAGAVGGGPIRIRRPRAADANESR